MIGADRRLDVLETDMDMIERLPLELFDDDYEPGPEPVSDVEPGAEDLIVEVTAEPVLVTCPWCAERFDNELADCPGCGAAHLKVQAPPVDPELITCQWCQSTFETGPLTCPTCDARVIVPGQRVPGENDPFPDYANRGMLHRYSESNRMLVGMMAGGMVDSFTAGLIGIALTLFDDD